MSSSPETTKNAAPPLAAIAVAGALTFLVLGRPQKPSVTPLDAMPQASFLVATIDVATLRDAPLFRSVFGKDRVETLTHACGFDPLARIDEIDVAIPEAENTGEFGIGASGAMSGAELARCAEAILTSRGSVTKTSTVGTFTQIDGESGGPRLAYREGGPFLVGRGAWLTAMIDTAEDRRPSVRREAVHTLLRTSLEDHARAKAEHVVLLVSAILPKELRDRLKQEMGAEAEADGAGVMNGVLGVAAAGLTISVSGSASDPMLEAELQLRCESDEACGKVADLVAKKRLAWSKDLMLRMVGLGPLVDELKVTGHGSPLTITTRARAEDVAATVERLTKMGGGPRPGGPRGRPEPPNVPQIPAFSAKPDEILKARRDPPRDAGIGAGGR